MPVSISPAKGCHSGCLPARYRVPAFRPRRSRSARRVRSAIPTVGATTEAPQHRAAPQVRRASPPPWRVRHPAPRIGHAPVLRARPPWRVAPPPRRARRQVRRVAPRQPLPAAMPSHYRRAAGPCSSRSRTASGSRNGSPSPGRCSDAFRPPYRLRGRQRRSIPARWSSRGPPGGRLRERGSDRGGCSAWIVRGARPPYRANCWQVNTNAGGVLGSIPRRRRWHPSSAGLSPMRRIEVRHRSPPVPIRSRNARTVSTATIRVRVGFSALSAAMPETNPARSFGRYYADGSVLSAGIQRPS